jgi:hypothetical protein
VFGRHEKGATFLDSLSAMIKIALPLTAGGALVFVAFPSLVLVFNIVGEGNYGQK